MTSVKNLPAILKAIQEGTAPPKFTIAHLKSIGFKSSNDQGIIPLLKDLGFLTADGAPTQTYHDYRDQSQSKAVLGRAIKATYEDLFHVKEKPTKNDRQAIEGKFKATNNATDRVAQSQATTFFALLDQADIAASDASPPPPPAEEQGSGESGNDEAPPNGDTPPPPPPSIGSSIGLRYNIEIHLPATKETEVYNAIFKSLKEHLLDS